MFFSVAIGASRENKTFGILSSINLLPSEEIVGHKKNCNQTAILIVFCYGKEKTWVDLDHRSSNRFEPAQFKSTL